MLSWRLSYCQASFHLSVDESWGFLARKKHSKVGHRAQGDTKALAQRVAPCGAIQGIVICAADTKLVMPRIKLGKCAKELK